MTEKSLEEGATSREDPYRIIMARPLGGGNYALLQSMRMTSVLCSYENSSKSFEPNLKGSPYSITERRVPELIPVLGSQPAGDVSHKPGGRLPLLSATPATLKRAATSFAAW